MMTKLFKLGLISLVLGLVACSNPSGTFSFPYQPNTQQGNWITQEQTALLRKDMSKSQVSYLLGTPLLVDVFDDNKWVYTYLFKAPYRAPIKRNYQLVFKDGKLVKWGGDPLPDFAPYDDTTAKGVN